MPMTTQFYNQGFSIQKFVMCHAIYIVGLLSIKIAASSLTISVRQAAVAAQRTMTFRYDRSLQWHS